jgi:hypothetical protein
MCSLGRGRIIVHFCGGAVSYSAKPRCANFAPLFSDFWRNSWRISKYIFRDGKIFTIEIQTGFKNEKWFNFLRWFKNRNFFSLMGRWDVNCDEVFPKKREKNY